MTGDRSPQPSKDAWEAVRHHIHHWYLRENLTCEKIKGLLQDRGFCVSERQIKNRLSEWKFERKKTPHQHYLAMSVVACHYSALGTELEFNVPKREERVTYSVQKVKKEAERVQKRSRDRHENIKLPSFCDAQYILHSNKIFFGPRHFQVQQSLTWPPPFYMDTSRDESLQNRELSSGTCSSIATGLEAAHTDTNPPHPGHCATGNHQDTPAASLFSVRSSNPFSRENNLPMETDSSVVFNSNGVDTTDTPPQIKGEVPLSEQSHLTVQVPVVHDADHRLPTLNGTGWGHADNHNPGTGGALQSVSTAQPSFVKVEPSSPSNHGIPSPPLKSNYSPEAESSRALDETDACSVCPAERRHTDYDFTEPIMQAIESFTPHRRTMQQDEPSPCKLLNGPNGPAGTTQKTHKMGVSTWAAHYYMTCFSKDVHEDALKKSKEVSMEALKRALKLERTNNYWILPCLNWTVLVLGTTMRMQQLADLLQSSRRVISAQKDLHGGPMYEVIFWYVWAWASNNNDDVRHYGGLLMRSYDEMRALWPGDNPNFLVCSFLCAFHSIESQDFRRAIQILSDCMPISVRVMGCHDLLTINCLAIASRANAQIGNLLVAVKHLQDAMEAARFLEGAHRQDDAHRPALQDFRLDLLDRHAELMLRLFNDNLAAEKQFWRVLQIRTLLDGFDYAKTWFAAERLGEILKRTGRTALYHDLDRYLHARRRWEYERNWYRENGKTPPPPPQPRPETPLGEIREASGREDIRKWLNIMDSRALAS